MYQCRHCKIDLTYDTWPKHRSNRTKPDKICRQCFNEKAREYQKDYKFYHKRDIVSTLISGAKARATRKGLEFDLEYGDVVLPDVCPVFGVPLERAEGGFPLDNSPTLDRVDSTRGYVKGNVQIVSWKANRLKSNGTLEDFKSIVRWLESV
jgi:hypothetical protein